MALGSDRLSRILGDQPQGIVDLGGLLKTDRYEQYAQCEFNSVCELSFSFCRFDSWGMTRCLRACSAVLSWLG